MGVKKTDSVKQNNKKKSRIQQNIDYWSLRNHYGNTLNSTGLYFQAFPKWTSANNASNAQ